MTSCNVSAAPEPSMRREAAHYHDRFVSNHANDREFDNNTYHEAATQYLGKLPDDQFRQAAGNAVAQMPQQQRAGLLNTLMGALGGAGGCRRHRRIG